MIDNTSQTKLLDHIDTLKHFSVKINIDMYLNKIRVNEIISEYFDMKKEKLIAEQKLKDFIQSFDEIESYLIFYGIIEIKEGKVVT